MKSYIYIKPVKSDKLQNEIFSAGLTSISFIETVEQNVIIYFHQDLTEDEVNTLNSIVGSHQPIMIQEIVENSITNAIKFGEKLLVTYAAENVMLGITQDGMTGVVIDRLGGVITCLQSGSLYDVIVRIKAIPQENYDSKYITAIRLLSFVNKVEDYLGLPKSTSL